MLHDASRKAANTMPLMAYERLQKMYSGDEFYWGTEPNSFARKTLEFIRTSGSALDLGAGEGRDAVLFAANGLDVLAVDVSENALRKAHRLAAERGVTLRTEAADLNAYAPRAGYGLVYSIGTVQYIAPENRAGQFDRLKAATVPGGINAVFAFANRPDVPPAPDFEPDEHPFEPGELRSYYGGWEILHERGFVFDDDSEGAPHKHAAEELIVHKPEI